MCQDLRVPLGIVTSLAEAILGFWGPPAQGQEYGQGREWNCYQSLDWHEGEESVRKGGEISKLRRGDEWILSLLRTLGRFFFRVFKGVLGVLDDFEVFG